MKDSAENLPIRLRKVLNSCRVPYSTLREFKIFHFRPPALKKKLIGTRNRIMETQDYRIDASKINLVSQALTFGIESAFFIE